MLKIYFMANVRKVSSLIEKKRIISKEIEEIQNECTHFNKSLKSTKEHEAASTFIFRWICDECERVVGIPNDQEINKYINK